MDRETFESKLREAKRQKVQVEQELESVSERWRSERRRLHSEIDRLEAALLEAKENRKRAAPAKNQGGIDPAEVAKMQAAAEERVKRAEDEFETERERLRSEISRLQRAVAELIERSNNPMRSTEPIREQFQAQLDAAFKAKQQVEEDFYRARASWEQEKLKMTGELFKARREPAPKSKGKAAALDRNADFERELQDLKAERDDLQKQLRESEAHRENDNKKSREEAERLQRTLASSDADRGEERRRSEMSLQKAEAQSEELLQTIKRLERELKNANAEVETLRGMPPAQGEFVDSDAIDQIRRQYDDKLAQMTREKNRLSEQLKSTSSMLEQERSRSTAKATATAADGSEELRQTIKRLERELKSANAEVERLRDAPHDQGEFVDTGAIEQLRRQYDDKLAQMTREKSRLSEQLNSASSLLEQERSRSAAKATATAAAAPSSNSGATEAEIERVQQMINDIARLIDDPATELSMVIRKNVEKAELDAYLKGILFSTGRYAGL